MKQIALLGDGAWGTAVATLLAHNGYTVKLWCYNQELVNQINQNHTNQNYLPDIKLSPSIVAYRTIAEAVAETTTIFQAIPVKYLRATLASAKKDIPAACSWVSLSKGIEHDTGMVPTEIIQDIFGSPLDVAAVSGPSFARDLINKNLIAMVVAANNLSFTQQVANMLQSDYVKIYLLADLKGIQLCGAFKNVIALAIGLLEGAGYSESTRAFVMTKGVDEMQQLVTAMGGLPETIMTVAGIGDLVLTSYSNQSKNRQIGKKVGQGESLDSIIAQYGYTPEGVNTLQSIIQLADRFKLKASLCRAIYNIFLKNKDSKILFTHLTE